MSVESIRGSLSLNSAWAQMKKLFYRVSMMHLINSEQLQHFSAKGVFFFSSVSDIFSGRQPLPEYWVSEFFKIWKTGFNLSKIWS